MIHPLRLVLPLAFSAATLAPQRPAPPPPVATGADFCAASRRRSPAESTAIPLATHVSTPDPVRGLYVNRWAALDSRLNRLIAVAAGTEINTLVFDIKDDRGLLLYRSLVPMAHAIGADTGRVMKPARLRAVLDTLRALGVYPIARIVVVKDPLLAAAHPEWTIRARRDSSRPWLDQRGNRWLDPHQDAPWLYAAALACEAVEAGFSEVQFDYVRFPDDARLVRDAAFPLARGRTRARVIREQLLTARTRLRSLGVPITADVFGLTTTDTTDMGIGQQWEMLADAVDVILPMMYPSHYFPGLYGLKDPNAEPHTTVSRGLRDALRRSATVANAAPIRPWYQDFTLGPPHYGAPQVRAQITAGYERGVMSWLLWNPRSVYSLGALAAKPTPELPAPPPATSPPSAREPLRQ